MRRVAQWQIKHPDNPGIDACRMLNLERGRQLTGIEREPQHIDKLDRTDQSNIEQTRWQV